MGAIAIELAERLGPSLEWWLTQPFAFGLWSYYHLQELDRRREFRARLARVEAGLLAHYAMHAPERLGQHERAVIAEASSATAAAVLADPDIVERARAMAREIEAGGVV